MSIPRKARIFTLAVFGALVVANAQPVFAQKSYQMYSIAQTFSSNVVGLGAIAANGTFVAYYRQGYSALDSRGGSTLPLANPPGLVDSYYFGVNASLTTAGTGYLEDGSDTVAFVREDDGRFRFLSFPPNSYPQTTAINNNGDVVGYYYDQDGIGQGFIANAKGIIRRIDVPGGSYVQPMGVNASGVVVGNYADENGSHSFIMDGKGVREWTFPGASFVYANCINNNGAIGGWYGDGTNAHAFVSKGGKVTTIDYENPDSPDSYTRIIGGKTVLFVKISSFPAISGINDRGDVVGYTFDVYKATDPSIQLLSGYQRSFWGTTH